MLKANTRTLLVTGRYGLLLMFAATTQAANEPAKIPVTTPAIPSTATVSQRTPLSDPHLREPGVITLNFPSMPHIKARIVHAALPNKGGILVLHPKHVHVNRPTVVGPLRMELPKFGWTSLGLEFTAISQRGTPSPSSASALSYTPPPAFVATTTTPSATPVAEDSVEWVARNTLAYMRDLKLPKLVLLVYELDESSLRAVLATVQSSIHAMILIGVDWTDMQMLAEMQVLDVLGSKDYPGVIQAAQARSRAAKQLGVKHYQQSIVTGADHEFSGMQAALIWRIRAWLSVR